MAEITWIKLRTNMFDDEKIKLLERLPDGDMIIVVWVKLLAQAGKVNCGGYIMIAENVPMHVDEMAIIFNRPLEKVKFALEALKRYGMIEVDENYTVFITNWEKHQNIDGMEKIRLQNAERNRRYRERKKLSTQGLLETAVDKNDDVSVTSRDALDIEKELEKEKECLKDLSENEFSNVSESKKSPSKKSESESLIEQQFDEWWNIYDKKTQKKKAFTKFKAVLKKHDYETLKQNTTFYVARFQSDKTYQKNPDTFLHNYEPDDIIFQQNQQQQPFKQYNNNTTTQQQTATNYKPVNVNNLFGDV